MLINVFKFMEQTLAAKEIFIKTIPSLFATLSSKQTGKWGVMNAQQMVEHVADFFKVSTQKIKFPLLTPIENLPKFKSFLLSDKEFKENTKAPMLPNEAFKERNVQFEDSIKELQQEVDDFFDFFKNSQSLTTVHPVFGELNFEEWILLHYKHVLHHSKQFSLA